MMLLAGALPGMATAADSHVAVSVNQSQIVAPATGNDSITYSYDVSFASQPDHLLVNIVGPDGQPTTTPLFRDLSSAQSPVAGQGDMQVTKDTPAGFYTVSVAYYAAGSGQWEARASKSFKVVAAANTPVERPTPIIVNDPAPGGTVSSPPTTNTTPVPTAAGAPADTHPNSVPVLLDQQSMDARQASPTATIERTKLALVVTQPSSTRQGRRLKITLQVTNTGLLTARNLRVCGRVPSHSKLVAAHGGEINGRQVCFPLATLRPSDKAIRSLTVVVRQSTTITGNGTATADNAATVKASARTYVRKSNGFVG